jgi:hypothetical protein
MATATCDHPAILDVGILGDRRYMDRSNQCLSQKARLMFLPHSHRIFLRPPFENTDLHQGGSYGDCRARISIDKRCNPLSLELSCVALHHYADYVLNRALSTDSLLSSSQVDTHTRDRGPFLPGVPHGIDPEGHT